MNTDMNTLMAHDITQNTEEDNKTFVKEIKGLVNTLSTATKEKEDLLDELNQRYRTLEQQFKEKLKIEEQNDLAADIAAHSLSEDAEEDDEMERIDFKDLKDLLPTFYKPMSEWSRDISEILTKLGKNTMQDKPNIFKITAWIRMRLPAAIRNIAPHSNYKELLLFISNFENTSVNILDTLTPLATTNIKFLFLNKVSTLMRTQPGMLSHTAKIIAWQICLHNAPQRVRDMSILLDIKSYPTDMQLDKVSRCGARIDTPATNTEASNSQYRPNRQFNNTGIQRNFIPNNFRGGKAPNGQANNWGNSSIRPASQVPQVNRPTIQPQQQRQQPYSNTRPNVSNQTHRYPTRFSQTRGGGSVANTTMGTRSLQTSPTRRQGGY